MKEALFRGTVYNFEGLGEITENRNGEAKLSLCVEVKGHQRHYIYGDTQIQLKENVEKYIKKEKEMFENKISKLEGLTKSLDSSDLKKAEENYQNLQNKSEVGN